MAILKSVGRLLANTILLPVDLVRDATTYGNEDKHGSFVAERGRRWVNAARDTGESIADVGVVAGSTIADASVTAGSAIANASVSVGNAIQDFADGKTSRKRIEVTEEEKQQGEQS